MVENGPSTRRRSWVSYASVASRNCWIETSSTFPRSCCAARPDRNVATAAWSWSTWTGNGAASGPSTFNVMRILVDHLTRMQPGYFCAAGIDLESGRHVRPVLRRGRLTTDLLGTNGGPFDIGSVLDLGP